VTSDETIVTGVVVDLTLSESAAFDFELSDEQGNSVFRDDDTTIQWQIVELQPTETNTITVTVPAGVTVTRAEVVRATACFVGSPGTCASQIDDRTSILVDEL